jgi:GT2 family glycosyltransferase
MRSDIDIAYFRKAAKPDWVLGDSIELPYSVNEVKQYIDELIIDTDEGWLLFWDYSLGEPDVNLLQELTWKPIDIWHSGVKLGLSNLPHALNYIDPTWMYNKNAPEDIEHTSFRLSIRCCLINKEVLRKVGNVTGSYTSLEAFGLALGYKILKSGGIIRYHPALTKKNLSSIDISVRDEWEYVHEFFGIKWKLWSLLNMPGKLTGIKRFLSKEKRKQSIQPHIHNSTAILNAEPATVSILAPTLYRYKYLYAELEQLSKQTVLPFEVLITDQTDKDEREAIDISHYPELNIRYFPQDEKGQCIAWNKLLEEAKGEYILFLGDDADRIIPSFIEKLLASIKRFDCDMVASNVIEFDAPDKKMSEYYYLTDTFPIAIIKRSLLQKTGYMDMFFNRNIRADHDLAMRCHLNGALMVFDSSAVIFHHRAPIGGLRAHKARVITNSMAKKSMTKFVNPTSSEIYLAKKYYSSIQVKNYIKIKYLNQLFIKGNVIKKLARILVFIFKIPALYKQYKINERQADAALEQYKTKQHSLQAELVLTK